MKFGAEFQENIFPPWRLSYIAYDKLNQELKTRQSNHAWTEKDEVEFIQLMDSELNKVYDFINAKMAEVDARILYCERTIQTTSDAIFNAMEETLTDILFDINDLSKFTRLNFKAIQKLLKKHDRSTGLSLKETYVEKLREKPLDKQRFDVALVYISALHDMCRNRGKPSSGTGVSQDGQETTTFTYWVHPDNVTEVKSIIMLHLPVHIFNTSKKFETSDAAVSNVYLDNSDFDLYTGRLQRDEMAEAIRLKWYGSCSSNDIYFERETHRENSSDGSSTKDRFCIPESRVNSFLSGQYTVEDMAVELKEKEMDESTMKDILFTATGIQASIEQKGLEPVLRVFYHRTTFQLPSTQALCISLDTDLAFIREDHLQGDWRRPDVGIDYPFDYLSKQDILRFPYAVLETRLGQEPPTWLRSLVEGHLVHEVPRFSKYLHGVSHLYKKHLPLVPWWLSEMNADIRKPRIENLGLTRSRSFKPLIDGQYRRAAIQERERSSRQVVMRDTKLNGAELSRRNSNDNLAVNEGFTLIELNPSPEHSTVHLSSSATQPLLSDNASSVNISKFNPKRNKPFYSVSEPEVTDSKGHLLSKKSLNEPVDLESGAPKKVIKVKLDPKTFFSNERTFISWLQFCALLLTVALNLLNFGDNVSRIVGGVFIGVSSAVALYALYRFEKRAWMISRRSIGRYDDLWGPAILCLILVVALILNLYLRFR
ncbi:hypothetical protein G6F43_006792 [Rhizopus delemar]|nr:hypothetical protein G6F43_006792 [Rhizopus delemar]